MPRLPLLLLLALGSSAAARATVPVTLSTSGYLVDANDQPITATGLALSFSVWTDATSTDGVNRAWPASGESVCSADVKAGYYALVLDGTIASGCGAGLTSDVFAGGPTWLQVTVGAVTLAPRQRLGVAPRAALATQSLDTQALATALGTGGSSVNGVGSVVDWKALKGVPAAFADGTDDGAVYAASGGLALSAGTFSIAPSGVTNGMLQNSGLTIGTSAGLTGGGPVALGGSLSLGLADLSPSPAGTFTIPTITVDAKGRITSATSGSVSGASSLAWAVTSLALGTVVATPSTVNATISNPSTSAATGLAFTVPAPFTVNASACGTSLAAGASCSVAVTLPIAGSGAVSGVVIATAASGGAAGLPVSGTVNGLGLSSASAGVSCQAIKAAGQTADGLYWLQGSPNYQNWCDMTVDNGGWVLVMQIASSNGGEGTMSYNSGYWTGANTLNDTPAPTTLPGTSVNAKYGSFNTYTSLTGKILLRDRSTLLTTTLSVPGLTGTTLLNRFTNLPIRTNLTLVAGAPSPQELMGYAAPSGLCGGAATRWMMNAFGTASHVAVRLGNDVATNAQVTNDVSTWPCYNGGSMNLAYSGAGAFLESPPTWFDGFGSESLSRWRSSSGTGQGSHHGLLIYVQ